MKAIPQQAVRSSLSGQQVTAQPFQLITTGPLSDPDCSRGRLPPRRPGRCFNGPLSPSRWRRPTQVS
ncbi:unnamed protein product [Callosobruchus maculatus]|uniref:Uncharacterized protein n=1 Tax=Callosobruchus maculatus TaxID=64391 RepID=A0A653CYK7_CALMS|nr:unnamed protein product [Callosobruchus maculatus]